MGFVQLRRDLVDAIVAHARRDHPDEACGVIAGPEGTDRAERIVPMLNVARSPTYYEFDAREWLALHRELTKNDEEVVVVYHSHTATEAYPSRTDIGIADHYAQFLRSPHYVLVSTREPDTYELRSFTIVDGVVDEEPVDILDVANRQF
jgi:proteasome lid subunit RPN8/RPN11